MRPPTPVHLFHGVLRETELRVPVIGMSIGGDGDTERYISEAFCGGVVAIPLDPFSSATI